MRHTKEEYEKQWNQNFIIAQQYYIEFSNIDVPFDTVYKNFPLGH